MTFGEKVKNCYVSLKGAQATLEILVNKTTNEEAKAVYTEVSNELSSVLMDLETQLVRISKQEAEYQ